MGVRVEGLVLHGFGLEIGIKGLGFRVQGLRLRVLRLEGLGCRDECL